MYIYIYIYIYVERDLGIGISICIDIKYMYITLYIALKRVLPPQQYTFIQLIHRFKSMRPHFRFSTSKKVQLPDFSINITHTQNKAHVV